MHTSSWAPNAVGSPQVKTAGLGLCIKNIGTTSTCMRPQESIVDLTWVSPSTDRIVWDWRLVADAEPIRS